MQKKLWIFLTLSFVILCSSFAFEHTKPNKIQAIIFDFGGVIGKADRSIIHKRVAEMLGVGPQEIPSILSSLKNHLHIGGDEQLFWEMIAHAHNKELPKQWIQDFRILLASSVREIPGTLSLIKSLKQQGYQVGLLSNVRKDKAEVLYKLGYYDHFQPLLLSCNLGLLKPDPKIYQVLLDTLKLPSDACLFIDNKQENVIAAKKFGIDSIYFTSSRQLTEELAKRGVNAYCEK